jgi:hypothetical protein
MKPLTLKSISSKLLIDIFGIKAIPFFEIFNIFKSLKYVNQIEVKVIILSLLYQPTSYLSLIHCVVKNNRILSQIIIMQIQ